MDEDPEIAALLEMKRQLEEELKAESSPFAQPAPILTPPKAPVPHDDGRKRKNDRESHSTLFPATPEHKRHKPTNDRDDQPTSSAVATSTPGSDLSESPIRTPPKLADNSGLSDTTLVNRLTACPFAVADADRSLERLTDTSVDDRDAPAVASIVGLSLSLTF